MLDKKRKQAKYTVRVYYSSMLMFFLYFGVSLITLILESSDRFNFRCGGSYLYTVTCEDVDCNCIRFQKWTFLFFALSNIWLVYLNYVTWKTAQGYNTIRKEIKYYKRLKMIVGFPVYFGFYAWVMANFIQSNILSAGPCKGFEGNETVHNSMVFCIILMLAQLVEIIYEIYKEIRHCCKRIKKRRPEGTIDLSSDENDDRLFIED